jgi:hypothetical protein
LADAIANPNRQGNLDRRTNQRDHAHRLQVFERELDAQGKEEQGHPDLSQKGDVLYLSNSNAPGIGADDDARQNIADNERLA